VKKLIEREMEPMTDIIRYMTFLPILTRRLINDYDVTTVRINNDGTFTYTKQGEKLTWHKFELEVIDMDGVKIDKVMVKSLRK
jgi:hypothetical protein